jgi:hypothetical protein
VTAAPPDQDCLWNLKLIIQIQSKVSELQSLSFDLGADRAFAEKTSDEFEAEREFVSAYKFTKHNSGSKYSFPDPVHPQNDSAIGSFETFHSSELFGSNKDNLP